MTKIRSVCFSFVRSTRRAGGGARNRRGRRAGMLSVVLLAWILVGVAGPRLSSAQEIFLGDFETGSVHPWSDAIGLSERLFRFRDLDLRDPHIFVDASPFGCPDVTDDPFILVPALNPTIETTITTDGDGDSLLDASPLLVFRGGLTVTAEAGLVDSASGLCTAPIATTSCTIDTGATRTELLEDGVIDATCLEALAGTTSGYTPPVGSTPGPCFVTRAQDLTLDLGGGLGFPLREAQIAATFELPALAGPGRDAESPGVAVPGVAVPGGTVPGGTGTETLGNGLIRGFLSEADADQIVLPPELGGAVLSSLLPGGTGNCAAGDDRDMLDGVSGWWFHFEFEAVAVPFSP